VKFVTTPIAYLLTVKVLCWFGLGLLSPVACNLFPGSSGWIFYPLDHPYRLFANIDAGSSGIADFMPKFFGPKLVPKSQNFGAFKGCFCSVFVNPMKAAGGSRLPEPARDLHVPRQDVAIFAGPGERLAQ